MVEKQIDMKNLINEAIDASITFEELMDKTDFDSWFENEDPTKFEKIQDPTPFEKFENDIKELRRICCQIKNKWGTELHEPEDKSSNEISLIFKLFDAKIKRVEARICSQKEDGEEKYKDALYHLLSALNPLQKPKGDNIDKRWLILLYNDLSICYAGLENSSMSRGYAQEARWLIEKKEENYEESYKKFCQKLDAEKPANRSNIKEHDFVSSKLYALYTVAIYNQAVAEKRSYYYSDAEKNFRRIIDFAEMRENRDTPLRNFNYCSTLLNLSDLYIDLGRGEEAIELLKKIGKDENDIRYWNACIAKINALIDQSKYDDANDELYKNIIEKKNGYTLNRRHRITSTGFKGLNCFVRCIIDSARNDLTRIDEKKECELKKAVAFIYENEVEMQERNQKGSVTKAYRQLSDIHKILSKEKDDIKYDRDIRKYLIKFISENEFISVDQIDDLDTFISDTKKMGKWIDKCDDLDALESFTDQIIKVITDNSIDKYKDLLEKLKKKIIKECEDKGQLARAEKNLSKFDKLLGEKKGIKYRGNILFKENSPDKKKGLSKEEIRIRLDINEKEFDKGFFGRSKKLWDNHIIEMIVLRRWNSFSPGLYRESTGSLGGGYLLRIRKDSYLFSFSDIMKEEEKQKLLKCFFTLGYSGLVKNIEDAKFSEEGGEIRISRNNHRIATLKIEKDICYLEWDNHDKFKIGVVKKEDNKLNIYSEDPHVENIVIDPGYNFVQNFRSEGFHVEDIDTIIVTHSHLDHCAELLQIMDLLYQFNKRYKDTPYPYRQKKRVNLCISKGAYKKFSSYIDDPDWKKQLKDVIILENLDGGWYGAFDGLQVSAIKTRHWDLGGVHSIGLKIEINIGNKNPLCIGFTGDTPWDPKIKKAFLGCDLLCVHLGSLKYQEIGYTDDRYNLKILNDPRKISLKRKQRIEFYKKFSEANHLLFHGTLDFIECCADKDGSLIIVGEFGEELKYGLRTDLCKKLSDKTKVDCLPGDIGFYVGIEKDGTKKVRCNFCEEFVGQKEIETFTYGREDAIHYICESCDNTLTDLQKQAIIEHRVTRH